MNQYGGAPIYTVRGAQPRPVPGWAATRPSWRGPLIVLGLMFGWLIVTFALGGFVAPSEPSAGNPIQVGLGVSVTPAGGWYSASDVWDVGADAVSLQKSGAYVAFWVAEYSGTNDDLLTEWLGQLEPDFTSYRVLPASPTTVAGGVPGLSTFITGGSENWEAENELVVATAGGIGVVMLATAPEGQMARVQGDLDSMLGTMVVPR